MREPKPHYNATCRKCAGRGVRKDINPEWLAWARARAGLSFRGLSELVGFSIPYLHDIEHGRKRCPAKVVLTLRRLVKTQ